MPNASMVKPELSIIIPVLNEAAELPALLTHLAHWQQRGAEVVLVDGGSTDQTSDMARDAGFEVVVTSAGRANQMNAGALASHSERLLFLHADTRLPDDADQLLSQAFSSGSAGWGRFDVVIEGRSKMLPVIAALMNWRSRLSGIATGDQALFMTRTLFNKAGGFPEQPLMEDIEISKRLKRISRPICLSHKVTTSGRRWDTRGSWSTILLMWQLRWAYWRGVPTQQLIERYR
ncbi:TIGR04283 family arsenosugar biosynthesis glycosyltransferase [Marinobacter sp. AL4B]|uniref:TIGR04283 family arsenosugar biosynthesis glycosyltransferase n=1 Tax=Marinobacter sp. AL4B TaxID=2871173 RepID=UPI002934639F|nr:TIGR04283 family arsenosugar biosynthesis glycosyltransferase [Marinobacter sp. AL4B]